MEHLEVLKDVKVLGHVDLRVQADMVIDGEVWLQTLPLSRDSMISTRSRSCENEG